MLTAVFVQIQVFLGVNSVVTHIVTDVLDVQWTLELRPA